MFSNRFKFIIISGSVMNDLLKANAKYLNELLYQARRTPQRNIILISNLEPISSKF